MKKYFLLLLGLVFSGGVYAGQWSGYAEIEAIYPSSSHNGVLIQHGSMPNPDSCSNSSWYVLEKDNPLFNEIFTLIAAAQARKSQVNLHVNGCGGYNNVHPVITLLISK